MPLVAGIDSSTTATKVVVRDSASGELVGKGRADHPPGTEVPPAVWERALQRAAGHLLEDVAAIAVGAQQHGLVALDEYGEVVRDALLWNDLRSSADAADLIVELGGPASWADAIGTVPVASLTITKLRWLARVEPEVAKRVATVLLPHDWLTWRLGGASASPVTDRGDASGTGYWSPATGEYRPDLLERALGFVPELPRVLEPNEAAGATPAGAVLGPGTGDNMAAALGCGAREGDVIVSIGTSGVVAAVSDRPTADTRGYVAGFADATGHFLPLVCTLNAARVLAAAARVLRVDPDGFDRLALAAPPGAGGLVLLPYLEGERTPNLPNARGSLLGLTLDTATPETFARATVEGLLCGLADGLDALRRVGVAVSRAALVGGGARSRAVQELAAGLLGIPVTVPAPAEYVADGAALQAAWTLAGTPLPPEWPVLPRLDDVRTAQPQAEIRAAYAAARDSLFETAS